MAWAGPRDVCPWNGTSYSASMTFAAPASAASGFPTTFGAALDVGVAPRMYLCRSSEVGNGAVAGFCQLTLSCRAAANRLLFPLADDGDVVALAHDLDESRDAANGGFVDADERRAGDRRLHVARVHHAGKLDVDGPLQRAVHLGGNVVALRRLADDLELLHRLELGHAGGRVGVVARQRDVEPLSADQFAVGDFPRGIGRDRDHALADGELIDRHAKPR